LWQYEINLIIIYWWNSWYPFT